ncbi:hypothetical protein [Tenacibaculum finnmarkense]|uniref:hypothetical protein n=1 Tax=Tenacibaculum finnmarkense TaxID=2781243 RepID=UPI001E45FC0F|nr:hypothetical protein [Tenacibaculum finnmarkense]MCD8403916.1 hypothetical protein [Tenacibaculum finnmarkense genomovar finnmarkense]
MEQNNSKIFRFNEKTDYIYYLSELITDLIQKKDRLTKYHSEIEFIIKNNPNAKFISSELYESISDKTNRLFQYLFNLIGDESKKAVSYRKFRKILYKQRNQLNITLEQLTQDENKILSDFNSLRNWGLHIPESLYLQKRVFFKLSSDFINANKNIIPIPQYDNFEIEFLIKMEDEIGEVLECCEKILNRMKTDYSSLIGQEFKIEYEENLVKPYMFMKAVEKSWNVQTKK